MTDIPDEIMQRAEQLAKDVDNFRTYAEAAQHVSRALLAMRAEGYAAAREQAAKVAKCASDDRPRRDNIDWNDGFQDGCRAAETAIRAMEMSDE